MPSSVQSTTALNIQEKVKNVDKKPPARPPVAEQVALVAAQLGAPGIVGDVLRVLVGRLRHPAKTYTSKELEVLLVLTIALKHARMWPL